MNVFKFGNHMNKVNHYIPKTIFWKPLKVKYPPKKINPSLWKIFSQQAIILKPGETKVMVLGFGFLLSKGMVLTSLSYNLKFMQLSLSNEVILEDTIDIIVAITNNKSKPVEIKENEFLCYVYYTI